VSDDRIGPYQIGIFTLRTFCFITAAVNRALIGQPGLGIGRFGAFIGPLLAGELMRNHWTAQDLFHAAAVPAAISALALVALRWTGRVA
jgi:hypothetical protein